MAQPLAPNLSSEGEARLPGLLVVTGLSGAGKSTALRALEDRGFETVDNLPLSLLTHLLETASNSRPLGARPIAVGIDTRTMSFDAEAVVAKLAALRDGGLNARLLFLDCTGGELIRRFSETRRRHPLAPDRPASDGIAREREILEPLRRAADTLIDTTGYSVHDLKAAMTSRFGRSGSGGLTLTLMSFGFSRGVPRDADMVFDMRFLQNPHWDDALRPQTGRDVPVGDFIARDPAFAPAFERIADLLTVLLPSYIREGKAYLTVAIGCTGGRHRSVYVTERLADHLRAAGAQPNVIHRDLPQRADSAERRSERADAEDKAGSETLTAGLSH